MRIREWSICLPLLLVLALQSPGTFIMAQNRNEKHVESPVTHYSNQPKEERLHPDRHKTPLRCGVESEATTRKLNESAQITSAPTSSPPITPVLGPQPTLFVLFNFLDNPITPISREDMYAAAFSYERGIANFYSVTSYQKISISGDVAGWFTIPYNENGTCDIAGWRNAAKAAASAAGYDLTSYTHFVYVWPQNNPNTGVQSLGCGWSGYSAGSDSYINAWVNPNGYFFDGYQGHLPDQLVALSCHEFGHGLGISSHAGTLRCDDGKRAIDNYPSCTTSPTADFDDVMAYVNPARELNAPHRAMLGWLDANQVQDIVADGTYVISPLEYRDTNAKALRLAKPDTNEFYYLSYRIRAGLFDSYVSGYDGVAVHIWDGYKGTATRALYVSPWTAANANTAKPSALRDGMRFEDSNNGIQIEQISHDNNRVTLRITFGRIRCQNRNPLVSTFMGTGGVVYANAGYSSQPFDLLVFNNNSVTCSASSFGLSSLMPPGWSALSSGSLQTVKAQSYVLLTDQAQTDAGSAVGDYSFSITATRSDAPTYAASSSGIVRITTTDVSAPSTPSNLSASANDTGIYVSWTPSTDNVGVGSYTLTRSDLTAGGVATFNTNATSYLDVSADPNHLYNYEVFATDVSGLRSGKASVRASATIPIVDITSPESGARVSGTVLVTVSVSDNQAVTKVELYVDNNLISSSTTAPFTNSWTVSRKVSAGAHLLQCKAYDVAGRTGTSPVIQVIK
jgi:M6 family metalloprotease-like protein